MEILHHVLFSSHFSFTFRTTCIRSFTQNNMERINRKTDGMIIETNRDFSLIFPRILVCMFNFPTTYCHCEFLSIYTYSSYLSNDICHLRAALIHAYVQLGCKCQKCKNQYLISPAVLIAQQRASQAYTEENSPCFVTKHSH